MSDYPRFLVLHDSIDGKLVLFNVSAIHCVYAGDEEDSEEFATAIDYGYGSTFYVRESVEEVLKEIRTRRNFQ